MFLLGLILILVLQFEGISGQITHLYYRSGQDAILSCRRGDSYPTTCSKVSWLYYRDTSRSLVVANGSIQSSPRAARLSLLTNCSLVIKNVTAEDAALYTCRQGEHYNVHTTLSVLTLSPYPPDADPERDGEVTLKCSLYNGLGRCEANRLRWLDETGFELLVEGLRYEVFYQTNCVSHLKVKRQSGRNNRRYSCQFVDRENNVIQDDYTPVFKEIRGGTTSPPALSTPLSPTTDSPDPIDPAGWFPLSSVMLAVKIAGMILIIVITVLLLRDAGALKEE